MTTVSANSVPDHRAETRPDRPGDHVGRETPDGGLNLTGRRPPGRPKGIPQPMIGVRLPPADLRALQVQAELAGRTVTEQARAALFMHTRMPEDVRWWLLVQGQQQGTATEIDTIIGLVRHLAARWPFGCRLDD